MSAGLIWSNFVAYSLQIGLLVGVAALAPAALRLRSAQAKLAYWYLLLIACLLLPAIRPWQRRVVAETVTVTSRVVAMGPSDAPAARRYSPTEIALAVVVLGAMARLGWLAAGLWRLRRYRKRSRAFAAELPWPARVDVRVAAELASPVTFGALRPVILLPPRFPEMDEKAREAILCHELLHVERGDWLFTVAEEVVRAAFWFHPAIWWLLGEIQLAREQAVDREVIARTNAREEYLDALLAIAGAKAQLDLAPAPLFLRKRHLKHRVVSILKESRMSRTKLYSALTASVCVLAAACWLVTNTFPLAAAPQVASDAPGVTVDVGGATLLHRAPVNYPAAARAKGIQGSVAVELSFDAAGNVADARVLSGPDELRKAALESALQWHFSRDSAGTKRVVTITFQLPAAGTPAQATQSVAGGTSVIRTLPPSQMTPQQAAKTLQALSELQRTNNTPELAAKIAELQKEIQQAPDRARTKRTIRSINIYGLSDPVKSEVMSRINLRVGNAVTGEEAWAALDSLRDYDEHLKGYVTYLGADELAIAVMAPSTPQTITDDPNRLRVGGNMQSTKLIRQPRPAYPPEAKAARIQGVVKLLAVIGKDGTVQQLEVISGHPLLVPSAMDAVRQWAYEPTLLNGNPVEVQTQIDVNYTLSQ